MNVLADHLSKEVQQNLFGNADLNMLWSCQAFPQFWYWVHVPDAWRTEENPHCNLLVIIHGTGCAAENYVREATQWADAHHTAILAPLFPSGLIDRNDFNSYKLLACDGIRYDQVLLAMIQEMEKRYPGVDGKKFFLFGHSGGGQFTNRFLLVHPDRVKAVSIGAPGRPTFLDFQTDYFWGVRNFRDVFDKDLDLDAVREVPVQITVGALDTKYIGESPYGTNRVARMKSLEKNFKDNGIKEVELTIIPGIEHVDGDRERIEACTAFFAKFL